MIKILCILSIIIGALWGWLIPWSINKEHEVELWRQRKERNRHKV